MEKREVFIKGGAVALGIGGDLADKTDVKEKRFNIITKNTRSFLNAV